MATTITIAGGNRITLQTAANAVTISGPNAQTAISGLANSETTYTSGTVSLSAMGNLTIRSTTGNQYQFSVAPQSVQAETQTFLGAIRNSETTYTSGTVNLSVVGGNMTIRSTTGQAFQFSISQSVQAETQTFVGGIAGSNTTYTSGTVEFTGSNMVTVKSSANQRIVIDATQSAQTQGILNAGISGGNTSGDTGLNSGTRLAFAGGNNITLSGSTAANATTITISAPNLGAGAMSAGVSNLGNSAGSTGVTGTRLVLVGTNNITLSQSTDANGGTVSISGGAGGGFSAGASNLGNTAGSTGVSGTRGVFVGTNNISLSQSTDANGFTISINETRPSFSGGVSNLGQTAGSTGMTGTRLVFVGSNDITLSQSTDANGGTISILDANPLSYYNPYHAGLHQTFAFANGSLYMAPYSIPEPGVQFDRVIALGNYSQATNSTLTVSVSIFAGFYTKNGSTLSLRSSASSLLTINGSGGTATSIAVGDRLLTMGFTDTLYAGNYWLGFGSRTSTAGANASMSLRRASAYTGTFNGIFGVSSSTNQQQSLGAGAWTATTVQAPNSVAISDLVGSTLDARQPPVVYLQSGTNP